MGVAAVFVPAGGFVSGVLATVAGAGSAAASVLADCGKVAAGFAVGGAGVLRACGAGTDEVWNLV